MKIARFVLVSAVLVLFACAAHAQGKPSPKDALLYFVWPHSGATIKGAFWCRFGLRNMGVTHAGDNFQNSGHHHLLVDVDEPLNSNEPIPSDKSHLHFGAGQPRRVLSCRPANIPCNWFWVTPATIPSIRRSFQRRSPSGSSRIRRGPEGHQDAGRRRLR
jgi:hypothetical protein